MIISEQQFEDWKESPVTEEILSLFGRMASAEKAAGLEELWNNMPYASGDDVLACGQLATRSAAKVQAYEDMAGLEFATITHAYQTLGVKS